MIYKTEIAVFVEQIGRPIDTVSRLCSMIVAFRPNSSFYYSPKMSTVLARPGLLKGLFARTGKLNRPASKSGQNIGIILPLPSW